MTPLELMAQLQSIRKTQKRSLYSLDKEKFGVNRNYHSRLEALLYDSDPETIQPHWTVIALEDYAQMLGYELVLIKKIKLG